MIIVNVKVKVVQISQQEQQMFAIAISPVQRVISINDVKVPDHRKIFIDKNKHFYYGFQNVTKYTITSSGYQGITLNGNTYQAYPKRVIVEDVTGISLSAAGIVLRENGVYRLKNGTKMMLLAKVLPGEFTSGPIWVGVYKDGTVRYGVDGELLSHGGDVNWRIASEWKNLDLWAVTVEILGEFKTHTFQSERDADTYIKTFKSSASNYNFLAKTKIPV